MKSFDGQPTIHDIISGRVQQIDMVWYWTEWHVGYCQGGMDTSDNFASTQDALNHFDKRLADIRNGWGHKGAKFSETPEETNGYKRIRFRSILKSGKPGKLTGFLYMQPIKR